MKIAICDDSRHDCQVITEYITSNIKEEFEGAIYTFNSAQEIVSYCLKNTLEIIFLDIELGDMNGITLAKHLRSEFPALIIVYITNYPDYVFNCFETEPLDFLRKPITKEEFDQTFNRIVKKYTDLHKFLPIRWQNDSVNIEIKDICYIEGYNRHLIFHLFNGDTYEIIGKIDEMHNFLKVYGFVKTHQGFIVNMLYVKEFGESEIYMKNGDTVLMSVRKRLKTKEAYFNYINRRF